ncbi:unnamed protein product [Lactuca virosa]|uniref:Uncharacterized protein n=1 Tax=Lactuca virosa TaxID=75947 RepID=A0AAU9MSG6_9ASTR|nr:unnamed protein product [Lactuca virosa]
MMFLPYLNWLWATGLELDLVNFTIVLRIAMIFLLFSLPFALNPIASFNQHQKGSPHRFHTSNRSKIILLPHYYVFFRGQQNLGGSWVLLLLFLSVPYLCLTTNWALLHRHSPQTHPPSISHVTYVVRRSEEHQQGKQSGHQPSLISLSRRCLNKWKGLKKFMNPSSTSKKGLQHQIL